MFGSCFVMQFIVISSFAVKRAGCFTFNVCLVSCDC